MSLADYRASHSEGLLVVKRKNIWSPSVYPRIPPHVSARPEDVWWSYRGYEGQQWPDSERLLGIDYSDETRDEHGLAPMAQLPVIAAYAKNIENSAVIFCERTATPSHDLANFLGFDFGYYDADGCYSILFNEIIWGEVEPLSVFARRLNENLLFPDLAWRKEYFEVRDEQLRLGRDLEKVDVDFLPPSPIAIYRVPGYEGTLDSAHSRAKSADESE